MPKFSTTTHARKSEHFAAFCLMLPRSAEPLMMEWNNGVPDLPRWEMARYHCDIIHATYISNTLWRFVDARSVVFWLRRGGGREHGELAAGLARLANLTLAALSGHGSGAAQTLYGFMTRVKFPVSKQWCLDTIMSLTVFVRPLFFLFFYFY